MRNIEIHGRPLTEYIREHFSGVLGFILMLWACVVWVGLDDMETAKVFASIITITLICTPLHEFLTRPRGK